MMYEDTSTCGEVVTGIVQQAGDRNNVLVDLGKVESLLPRSERSTASARAGLADQGSDHRGAVQDEGPQVILSAAIPS